MCLAGRSRDSTHDQGADESGEPQRHSTPESDQSLVAWVVRARILEASMAQVILPDGRFGGRAPLLLEPVGVALPARSAEVEDFLATPDCTLQKMPVHEHIGVGVIV